MDLEVGEDLAELGNKDGGQAVDDEVGEVVAGNAAQAPEVSGVRQVFG